MAIVVVVGAAHALLLGVGVVHGKYVDIEGNMTRFKRVYGSLCLANELNGAGVDNGQECGGMLVHLLTKCLCRGDCADSKGVTKVEIFSVLSG